MLLGLGAIVVDFASVRQDRRLDRSASDSAALGGAFYLLPDATVDPLKACKTAWGYLNATLQLGLSSGSIASNCSSFSGLDVPTLCNATPSSEIDQDVIIGTRTIRIAWPIPNTGGSGFLNADIAPGNIAQPFDTSSKAVDGSGEGCDRLGVAIFHHQDFALGSLLGSSGTDTQVHSVALASVTSNGTDVFAALNILNPIDCNTLRTTGAGKVLVSATTLNDGTLAPGTIAVESTAKRTNPGSGNCSSNSDHVINANGSNSLVCANGSLYTTFTCDTVMKGVIYSRAKFTNPGNAYDLQDVLQGRLGPEPKVEPKVSGYTPVTKRYGCNLTRLPACVVPSGTQPNYVARLETAFDANPPTPYTATQAPYNTTYPYTGAFRNATALGGCGTVSGTVTLPLKGVTVGAITSTGNWYCPAGINVTGKLIVPQGNLVLQNGDLSVANGGCLIVNTTASACTTTNIVGSGATVTTNPAPTAEAMVYLKGGNFAAANGSSFLMPQTFVYARGSSAGAISINATTVALWTAPGVGTRDSGTMRTTLETACYDSVKAAVNENCMNSRFGRLAYWSDFNAPSTGPNKDTFQGGASSLFVVGVFFTPTAYFNLAGNSSLPIISQFWADILDVNGGARLPLTPSESAAVPIEIGNVGLIR